MPNTQFEVKFLTGSSAGYNELAQKDPYSFYLCTDTNRLYIGEELLTNSGDLAAAISRIAANEAAIATLNSDATVDGSIRKITAEAVAEIVAGADADFDTLKEIADWISGHAADVAAMNSAITNLQNVVGTIPDGSESTNIIDYIAEAIAAAGTGLPSTTVDDAGKVLKVDASGNWSKGEDDSTIYWKTF